MYSDSTKVFMESMGCSGWLAASGSGKTDRFHGPQIILLPEFPLWRLLYRKSQEEVEEGRILLNSLLRGSQRPDGSFISTAGYYTHLGNVQLGKDSN